MHAYTISYERLIAAANGIRAEAVLVVLDGEGQGVVRINAFYRDIAECFLDRAVSLALPEGRYAASLSMSAESDDGGVTITLVWQLCRRGRVLERQCAVHRWLLPAGTLCPEHRKSKK